MRIPHLLTTFGLTASALVGFAAVSQGGGTSQAAPGIVELDIRAVEGIPADATAAVLNIATARAQSAGYVAAWPCDQPEPDTSILNYRAGAAMSNSTVVSLSAEGTVCVSRSSDVDLIVDVNSALLAGGPFVGQNPERIVDTRSTQPMRAGQPIALNIAGQGSVPSDASAAVVHITAARASGLGHIVAWPCDQGKPSTTVLNFNSGPAISNTTTVPLGRNGQLCLEASSDTDVIVDANGSFGNDGNEPFVPQRLVDTRLGSRQSAGSVLEVDVSGQGGILSDASAVVLNIAAVRASSAGFVILWPCGTDRPEAASLNYDTQPISNTTIVAVGDDGKVCMSPSTDVDLVVDVNGAFPADANIATITPTRVIDTRATTPPPDSTRRPATNATFVETFDGNQGLERFDRGVWHRDDNVVSMTSWTGDHDENCGSPETQRPIQRDRPDDAIYTCRDHMMTSVGNTSGYSIAWFSPRQVFNGQTEISVDVNSTDLMSRQWFEFSLVPADYDSGVQGCPQCVSGASAVSDFFSGVPDNALVWGTKNGGGRLMIDYENLPRSINKLCADTALDPEGCSSKPIRRTWTMTDNLDGTITLAVPELGMSYTQSGSFPEGDWKLVVKDHNYTPTKDGMPVGFTWHWDNIVVN